MAAKEHRAFTQWVTLGLHRDTLDLHRLAVFEERLFSEVAAELPHSRRLPVEPDAPVAVGRDSLLPSAPYHTHPEGFWILGENAVDFVNKATEKIKSE